VNSTASSTYFLPQQKKAVTWFLFYFFHLFLIILSRFLRVMQQGELEKHGKTNQKMH
jgi:hypothetical protein